MKHTLRFSILFTLMMLGIIDSFSNPIDSLQALNFAQKFYAIQNPQAKSGRSGAFNFSIEQKIAYQTTPNNSSKSRLAAQDEYLYYVFNVGENNGFVIVSGDDAALPVLGYSTTGHFDTQNLPINLLKWMDGYKDQLQYIKDKRLTATSDIKSQWATAGLAQNKSARVTAVAPLIQTTWGQDNYYNNKTPFCTSINRSATGCTATAMAQIMRYWRYPIRGKGFGSYTGSGTGNVTIEGTYYDWDNMPNSLNLLSTSIQKDAVSTLMLHCGASINTIYGCSSDLGSNANPNDLKNAYEQNFSYSPTIQFISRNNFSDNAWKQKLYDELNASPGRPIQYAGYYEAVVDNRFKTSGHSFIIDGYDSNGFFHINWGWDGNNQANYWTLDALNPGSSGTGSGKGTYNKDQNAVIGIKPPTSSINYDIRLYSAINATVSGGTTSVSVNVQNMASGSYNFQGDIAIALFDKDNNFYGFVETKTGLTLNTGTRFTNPLTFNNNQLLYSPGNYSFGVYYRPTGGGWVQAGAGSYQNPKQVTMSYPTPKTLNMYNNITYNASSTPNPREEEWFSGQYNVTNSSSSTFNGQIGLWVYDIQGNSKGLIASQTISLPANNHFTNNLSLYTPSLNLEAGQYYLQAVYKNASSTSWEGVGSNGTYYNLIRFNVDEGIPIPDMYEVNDTENTAYTLPYYPNFTQGIQSTGSTLHNANDIDFYKIQLPEDSSRYFVNIRVHDSFSSNAGRFTSDVMFKYKSGNNAWSGLNDTYLPIQHIVSKGGEVKVRISPYQQGDIGKYLLDVNVTKYNQPNLYLNATSTVYSNATSTCVGGNTWIYASANFESYDWYKNNIYLTTSASNYFNATTTGIYSVKARIWGEVLNGANVFTVSNSTLSTPSLTASANGESSATVLNVCSGTPVLLSATCATNTYPVWGNGLYSNATSTSASVYANATTTASYTARCSNYFCISANSPPVRIVKEPSIQSVKTGDWQDATTWSCNCIPINCQDVSIEQGHTVNVPVNDAKAKNITVKGILNFQNNAPPTNSKVSIGGI